MPSRLKSISIDDNITFAWSAHAINSCFGQNYKAWMKAVYNISPDEYVWFPKLALIENGQPIAQEKVYGCINTLSEDGTIIRERHAEGCKWRNTSLIHVFAKNVPRDPYKFIGSFRRDLKQCKPEEAVYVREKTSIDLSKWYSERGWDLWDGKKSD